MAKHDCDKCGHEHTGIRFGYICIGCPCTETPGAPPGTKAAFDPDMCTPAGATRGDTDKRGD